MNNIISCDKLYFTRNQNVANPWNNNWFILYFTNLSKCFPLNCCYNQLNRKSDGSDIKMLIRVDLVVVVIVDNNNNKFEQKLLSTEDLLLKLSFSSSKLSLPLPLSLSSSSLLLLSSSSTFCVKFNLKVDKQLIGSYLSYLILLVITIKLLKDNAALIKVPRKQNRPDSLGIRIMAQNGSRNQNSGSRVEPESSVTASSASNNYNNRITSNPINTSWLVAIIFNASLATIFFLIFCYLCLKKSLRARKIRKSQTTRMNNHANQPYFTRKSIPTSLLSTSDSYGQPGGADRMTAVYTIPTSHGKLDNNPVTRLTVNGSEPLNRVKSPINKFRAAGRLTGRMVTSSPIDPNSRTLGTLDSFTESIPSSPAKYEPPIVNRLFDDTLEDSFQTESFTDDLKKIINLPGSIEEPKIVTEPHNNNHNKHNTNINFANDVNHHQNHGNNNNHQHQEKTNQQATNSNNNNHHNHQNSNQNQQNHQQHHQLVDQSTLSTLSNIETEKEDKEDKEVKTEKKAKEIHKKKENDADHKPETENNKEGSGLGKLGSRVMAKIRSDRKASVSIQTSPSLWLSLTGTVNLKGNPRVHLEAHPVYSEAFDPEGQVDQSERKYFIYLVSESTPYFRKNCIGKITLPTTQHLTLSQLRDYLLKTDDSSLQEILRRNKSFRFLTETYRFVAQNEATASIDQVYPTQGIFIKLSAPDYAMSGGLSVLTESVPGYAINRKRVNKDNVKFPSFINITESNPNKISKDRIDEKPKRARFARIKRENLFNTNFDQIPEPVATSDPRKRCARPTCYKPAIMGCGRCNNVFYCSDKCKNHHYPRHQGICSKPPWKF